MTIASGDGRELSVGWVGLLYVAPAGDGAIAAQPARVVASGGDRGESGCRRGARCGGGGCVALNEIGELASQRSTRAVVGKKRTRGSWRSPQELSLWRCWSPNSILPLASLRATMRTSPTGTVRGELASQRSTRAVVGKKRTRGSWRSPQELSVWRCWSPNSILPLASLRATMRTASSACWPVAAEETTAVPSRASSAPIATRTSDALQILRTP